MTQYEELDDRKILRVRDAQVAEIRAVPDFYMRLNNGVTLEFNGTVNWAIGRVGGHPEPRTLSMLSQDQLDDVIGATPLSWVVFNDGGQRIVLSRALHLTFDPGQGERWRLQLTDGTVFTYPDNGSS